MVRVLIVGAGVTGSICAYMLRRHLPSRLQCQITVWEKSRGVGGRMSLSKPSEVKNSSAELGAQYITQNLKYLSSHQEFYDELLDCDVIQPLEGKIDGFRGDEAKNFVSKNGLSAVAKHFFAKSSVEICKNLRLDSLRLISSDSSDWDVWEAVTTTGRHDHFDAIISTIPIPQIMNIEGVKGHLEEGQINDLKTAEYSSRFAVGLFYEPGSFGLKLPFVAKYVKDSDIVRYIAVDNVKRGDNSEPVSIVVHTSVPFGKAHLEEEPSQVGAIVLKELKRIIPDFPEPTYIKHHKWRYSQVTKPTNTYGCMVPCTKPLLVLAGDAFTHSNFDGCIESALKVNEEIGRWASGL